MRQDEVQSVAEFINHDQSVIAVNFSGGEPTLQVDLISEFQRLLNRPVHFTVTSNGWLGKRVASFLERVKVNEFTLSFDKWHSPFVNVQTLVDFVAVAIKNHIPVELNVVFESVEELAIAEKLVEAGGRLNATHLIPCGRAVDLETSKLITAGATHDTCPSIDLSVRKRQAKKITYFPGRGFSICCGPLAFDRLQKSEALFASSPQGAESTSIATRFEKGSFKVQASAIGLKLDGINFGTRCDACKFIYGNRLERHLPSLLEMATQSNEVTYYQSSFKLTQIEEAALRSTFHVKYFHVLDADGLEKAAENSNSITHEIKSILITDIKHGGVQTFTDFTERTFFDRNSSDYSTKDRQVFLDLAKGYFDLQLFGRLYHKNGRVIGLISTHLAKSHPATGSDLLHIGYWGYDKASLTVSEARWIKRDWIQGLYQWSHENGGVTIDASVDYFNSSAFELTKKLGFKLHSLRLDRKPQ